MGVSERKNQNEAFNWFIRH